MSDNAKSFLAKSTIKAPDKDHRRKINFNIGKYNAVVPMGKEQFSDIDLAREKAKNIKWKAIEALDKMLEDFEAAITKNGARVIWAVDGLQALEEIGRICKEKNCKTIRSEERRVGKECR